MLALLHFHIEFPTIQRVLSQCCFSLTAHGPHSSGTSQIYTMQRREYQNCIQSIHAFCISQSTTFMKCLPCHKELSSWESRTSWGIHHYCKFSKESLNEKIHSLTSGHRNSHTVSSVEYQTEGSSQTV